MKTLKNLYRKLFGRIEYIITILGVGGEVQKYTANTIAEVDEIISDCNGERYLQVQKIEKIRKFDFIYKGEVLHTPLWFNIEGVTETGFIGKQGYSFVVKDNSLACIKRIN